MPAYGLKLILVVVLSIFPITRSSNISLYTSNTKSGVGNVYFNIDSHILGRQNSSILCIDSNYNICSNISIPNIFIQQVSRVFKNLSHEEIIEFNGQSVKRGFDPQGLAYGVSLGGKTARLWSEVVHLINQSYELQTKQSNSIPKTVHLHNELKFGDLLELVIKNIRKANKKLTYIGRDDFNQAFDRGQPPIVITNTADENWGFLSTPINTRTTKWLNMTNHLLIHGANYQIVQHFLNNDKLTLLVGSNHVDPQIGTHPKIIGLPLGIKQKIKIYQKILSYAASNILKKKLLLINNSGWRERSIINEQISVAFDRKVKNSYMISSKRDHYLDVAQSLYVLCPSGLGFDTYRLWETLLLGSIPVVESNAGFDRTYASLPVLVVRNYSDVSPSLLVRAYPCFYENAEKFRYHHLTKSYWVDMVDKSVSTGRIDHVTENHPFRNAYCNYLSP